MKMFGFLAVAAITCLRLSSPQPDTTVTDVYDVRMVLSVPRVFDNMDSLGRRKVQKQRIDGRMFVEYSASIEPRVRFCGMRNLTHTMVGGVNVGYADAESTDVRWHYLGDNATLDFRTPSVYFAVSLWPTYNATADVDEDNSLYLHFSGGGKSSTASSCRGERGVRTLTRLKGYVVGTIGCGCRAFGHVSPTRTCGPYGATDMVVDIASVQGTWEAKFNRSESGRIGYAR